jgi:glutathione S-transferase
LNDDFHHEYLRHPHDSRGVLKLSEECINEFLPRYFKGLTKRLEANKDKRFIVGNTITIADFDCAAMAYCYVYNDALAVQKYYLDAL